MLPQLLKKGDTIAILAPAKRIEKEFVDFAVEIIESQGLKALVSKHCLGQHHYFSGTVKERVEDLQWAIDNENVKAILCARGGYGCIQLLDRINWAGFLDDPKWIVGFSDVTVFHQHLARIGVGSMHASMPLNFKNNTQNALSTLFECLREGKVAYGWDTNCQNIEGATQGEVIGGNLAVLAGLIGTKHMPDYQNKLLFIEDVGEHLYAIDRYFHQLGKSGILDQIRGLIIGDFSGMKDTNPPYGSDLQTIIKSHFTYQSIPIAFGFPAGHLNDNHALIFGQNANLSVQGNAAALIYD
jgi:muramoyltetrapeptide carboxypeptidase